MERSFLTAWFRTKRVSVKVKVIFMGNNKVEQRDDSGNFYLVFPCKCEVVIPGDVIQPLLANGEELEEFVSAMTEMICESPSCKERIIITKDDLKTRYPFIGSPYRRWLK